MTPMWALDGLNNLVLHYSNSEASSNEGLMPHYLYKSCRTESHWINLIPVLTLYSELYVNLTQARVIRENRASVEEMSL